MKPHDFLSYYAKQFQTVEIDSTYYGTPSASTVTNWYEKTPPDFVFAAKVPQVVTHEKVLKDCEAEFDEFIDRMGLLGEKLGPLLLQFPWFNKHEIQADEFFLRLRFFLQRLKDLPTIRFVVEIRNRAWLDKRLTDLLREYNVALALTDISRMPRPWEKKKFDWVTTDFVYVRWLGDRKGMETLTTTWDKTIITELMTFRTGLSYSGNSFRGISRSTPTPTTTTLDMGRTRLSCSGTCGRRSRPFCSPFVTGYSQSISPLLFRGKPGLISSNGLFVFGSIPPCIIRVAVSHFPFTSRNRTS